jgi:hypothetical protein
MTMTAPAWRIRLRDFAEDSERHSVSRAAWKRLRGNGVTLYCHGEFYAVYYDDAAILWEQADDDMPMFHVMVEADPPSRTVIHELHLGAWVSHLLEMAIPVSFVSAAEMEE